MICCVTTKDIYKKKIASKKQNLEHNCMLQESCKSRDVGRVLFYLSGGITALEIGIVQGYICDHYIYSKSSTLISHIASGMCVQLVAQELSKIGLV